MANPRAVIKKQEIELYILICERFPCILLFEKKQYEKYLLENPIFIGM